VGHPAASHSHDPGPHQENTLLTVQEPLRSKGINMRRKLYWRHCAGRSVTLLGVQFRTRPCPRPSRTSGTRDIPAAAYPGIGKLSGAIVLLCHGCQG
jgi:hypothetical protein